MSLCPEGAKEKQLHAVRGVCKRKEACSAMTAGLRPRPQTRPPTKASLNVMRATLSVGRTYTESLSSRLVINLPQLPPPLVSRSDFNFARRGLARGPYAKELTL